MDVESAVQLCFEMTDKIDFQASNISNDVKATNTTLRADLRNIRHKNIKLIQAKFQLKSQLEKAQQKIKDFEDMNVSDVEMMSFSQSLEHSMATQEKEKKTKAKAKAKEKQPKAKNGNDENIQCSESKGDENNPEPNDENDKLAKQNETKADENEPDDKAVVSDTQMSRNDSQGDLFSEDGTDIITQGSDMETADEENTGDCNNGSQGALSSQATESKRKHWIMILVKDYIFDYKIIKSDTIMKVIYDTFIKEVKLEHHVI